MSPVYKEMRRTNGLHDEDGLFGELVDCFRDVGVGAASVHAPGSPTVLVLTLEALASPAWAQEASELLTSYSGLGTPPLLLPLFSTAVPFGDYIHACPEVLRDLGLLKIMFQKWPLSLHLQRVAAAHACNNPTPLPVRVGVARSIRLRAQAALLGRQNRSKTLLRHLDVEGSNSRPTTGAGVLDSQGDKESMMVVRFESV